MHRDSSFLYATATGIGSMPYLSAAPALELIHETLLYGPHWPQLPGRGKDEGFTGQYLAPLVRLNLVSSDGGGNPFFLDEEEGWTEKVESFYQLYLDSEGEEGKEKALAFFHFTKESASGFHAFLEEKWGEHLPSIAYVKGHLSGPLSTGLQLTAQNKTAAFYRRELRDILVKTLVLIARSQIRSLQKFSLPALIFIDEPALSAFGQSTYVSLSRQDIVESFGQVITAITGEGALAGVHCCSGVDWSILFELPLQVVSFDAYSYFDSMLVYTQELESFLQQGGSLAWGLVPTSEQVEREDAGSLEKRFFEGVERLANRGVSPQRLRKQYLITPGCGTGTLTVEQAERVYRITWELQQRLKESLAEQ